MEPAKDLTIPCLSMKDSAYIQTQLVCDLNEQGTAAAMRPVFRGGLGWIPQAASFHWLIAPALVLLSATGAVPRGTGTQRNSSAAGRRRCPPTIQSTQADSLVFSIQWLRSSIVATHGAAAAPSDGYPPAPGAAQLDGARPPRCHGATARFGVRSLYSHRQGTVPSHLSAKFS